MMKLTEQEQALLDSCCSLCLEEPVLTTGDYRFCKAHKFRGEFLSWGIEHNYPLIETGSAAVAQGPYHWTIVATLGNDDMVYTLLAAIELMNTEIA